MRTFVLFFAMSIFLFSCENESNTENNETGTETATENSDLKYTLTPFNTSPEYPDANIGSMTYIDGKFTFNVTGDSYQLGAQTSDAEQKMCANSVKGQHIHLIVNNGPYNARYTASFDDVALDEGNYYLLAFLSRSYHESIKTKEAFTAQYVTVTDNIARNSESINDPMLFYSRPKGTYEGKKNTEKVMLDFYVINLELGDRYKVLADINLYCFMLI